MNLKSFCFGLGIGLAFTGLVSIVLVRAEIKNISANSVQQMSDEEIIEKAKALGMISYSSLPSKNDVTTSASIDKTIDNSTEKLQENTKISEDATEKINEAEGVKNQSSKNIIITIKNGQNARVVSEILKSKGLIEDSEDFRNYIGERNLSDKIAIGDFSIPEGSSYDQIIKIITGI